MVIDFGTGKKTSPPGVNSLSTTRASRRRGIWELEVNAEVELPRFSEACAQSCSCHLFSESTHGEICGLVMIAWDSLFPGFLPDELAVLQ